MKKMNKLLYSITPFVMVTSCLITLAIYTLITDSSGWGGVAAIVILVLSLILIVVDLIIKAIFKKYREWFIAEVIIGILACTWYYIRF